MNKMILIISASPRENANSDILGIGTARPARNDLTVLRTAQMILCIFSRNILKYQDKFDNLTNGLQNLPEVKFKSLISQSE